MWVGGVLMSAAIRARTLAAVKAGATRLPADPRSRRRQNE